MTTELTKDNPTAAKLGAIKAQLLDARVTGEIVSIYNVHNVVTIVTTVVCVCPHQQRP